MRTNLSRVLIFIICYFQLSCKGQILEQDNNSKNILVMKKSEIQKFEKNKKLDVDNNFSYTFIENDKVITITEYPISFSKSVSEKGNFKHVYIYDKETGLLKSDQLYFLNNPVDVIRHFDEKGNVSKEINADEGYSFTIQQLIVKMKNQFNLDLSQKNEKIKFFKLNDEETKQPVYLIYFPLNDKTGNERLFKINGITGEIIFEKIGLFIID